MTPVAGRESGRETEGEASSGQGPRVAVILVAAGRGSRLGGGTPKALRELGGRPMFLHSLATLADLPGLVSLTVVVARGHEPRVRRLISEFRRWPCPPRVVPGGEERQDSVSAGLEETAPEADLILIHDAARPFLPLSCATDCVAAAATRGAAIVAVPAQDSVKQVGAEGTLTASLDRTTIWLAQTPQVFRSDWLREALRLARNQGRQATDEATLVQGQGHPVAVVKGHWRNRKITNPEDLEWAEWLLARPEKRPPSRSPR